MLSLYNQTCLECSSLITRRYSTSFSMGIRVFDKKYRSPIYAIYGFVRFADEIVDTFHDFPKKELLDKFRKDTYEAIELGISLNPVLHSFQNVINKYNIEKEKYSSTTYKPLMPNKPTYFYITSILYGVYGFGAYIFPLTSPACFMKEIYRIEINLRSINDEKKTKFYNTVY